MTTTTTPTATTSDYWVTIPIFSSVVVLMDDLPSGLTKEELLSKIDFDAILPCSGEIYPQKSKEVCFEALETIKERPTEIEIEEDINKT